MSDGFTAKTFHSSWLARGLSLISISVYKLSCLNSEFVLYWHDAFIKQAKKTKQRAWRGVQSTLTMDNGRVKQIKQKYGLSESVESRRMRADPKSSGLLLQMYCAIVAVHEIKCPFLATEATLGGHKGVMEAVWWIKTWRGAVSKWCVSLQERCDL